MAVFWVFAPYSLVGFQRRFRGACCLHHQGSCTGIGTFNYSRIHKIIVPGLQLFFHLQRFSYKLYK
jgi:hypothetical protein